MDPQLKVIALVSGGKDSFFSLLHCLANGHSVVALANLHPEGSPASAPTPRAPAASAAVSGGSLQIQDDQGRPGGIQDEHEGEHEQDLNSFMYQTVGHQVIPLYADATGLPLYRQAIVGGSGRHGKDYTHYGQDGTSLGANSGSGPGSGEPDPDETESMVPLLKAAMTAHPEANAVCAGAILSTYQRTRVESVATRLGLVPLAYLWKFPVLPIPASMTGTAAMDAQLLDDMAAVGLETRIIKAATGGLDESFLWTNVASLGGKQSVIKAMCRFGAQETGAVIGEGGEFETLVLDGPPCLFRKRIVVEEEDRNVVREGGGTAWLKLRNAKVENKEIADGGSGVDKVRIPDLLDERFRRVLDGALTHASAQGQEAEDSLQELLGGLQQFGRLQAPDETRLEQWCFFGDTTSCSLSIEAETTSVVEQIRQRLQQADLQPSAIISTTILLRRMADFPAINAIYGGLFDAPNPPSRVTVSCDNQLHPGVNIAVYLAVHNNLGPGDRQGLHVQSRSYWAPANIGPYSQAISIPISSLVRDVSRTEPATNSPRLVTIAGQIPLVPATMALLTTPGIPLQLTLSLQHLWRIGLDQGVQWWSSAIAYFSSSPPGPEPSLADKARLAAAAWTAAHGRPSSSDEDNEDEDGNESPDLWDRKFDARYMSFGAEPAPKPGLPDWGVVSENSRAVPPVFAAEVAELPRGAGVEWHAHVGFAGVGEEGVVFSRSSVEEGVDVYCTVVSGGGVRVVQMVVAEKGVQGDMAGRGGVDEAAKAALESMSKREVGQKGLEGVVTARYIDVGMRELGEDGGPVVPCKSLWDGRGERLVEVVVHQVMFEG